MVSSYKLCYFKTRGIQKGIMFNFKMHSALVEGQVSGVK